MHEIKKYWNDESDSYYDRLNVYKLLDHFKNNPQHIFHPDTYKQIKTYCNTLKNKNVCVLASGDNLAAFAFSLLGAKVTSVDFSKNQLKNAEKISNKFKIRINYLCMDMRNLDHLHDNSFDLVFTSNGVFIWIEKLEKIFSEIYRILKKDGNYIFREVHPFQRPWKNNLLKIEVDKPYFNIGPFGSEVKRYHWKMDDIINSIVRSKLHICEIKEMESVDDTWWEVPVYESHMKYTQSLHDWKKNNLAALPVWLSVVCKRCFS